MRLLLPTFAHDIDDDGIKVFFAFMYRLASRDGFRGTRYFMHAGDIRTILQRFMVHPDQTFAKYADHLVVGKPVDWVWSIEWKQKPQAQWCHITDSQAALVWGYLYGLDCVEELTHDFEGSIPPREADRLDLEQRKPFQYFGDIKTRTKNIDI